MAAAAIASLPVRPRPPEVLSWRVLVVFAPPPHSGPGAAVPAGASEAAQMAAEVVEAPVQVETRRLDETEKIGRNDPCWCGSGKKFKKCHGA